MTKEQYYTMCEMMGTTPDDSEAPVEYDDLLNEVQESLNIYAKLRDDWDSTAGIYLGKQFQGITEIFNLYEVPNEDRRTIFELLNMVDDIRSKIINAKKK